MPHAAVVHSISDADDHAADQFGRLCHVHADATSGHLFERLRERPLLVAVSTPDGAPTRESVLDFLEEQVPRWWLPDDVIFVDELPLGATGKVQKSKLRERYGQG